MTHGPLSPAEYEQLHDELPYVDPIDSEFVELRFRQDSRFREKVWTVIACAVVCLGIGIAGFILWGMGK